MNANLEYSEDELADPLKSVIESIAGNKPDEVHMESFLSSLKDRKPIQSTLPRNSKSTNTSRSRLLVWLMSTAALVAILFGVQMLPTANALEQIARALTNVHCIKSTTVIGNTNSESWLVLPTGQTAFKDDQRIEFADSSAATLTTYDLRTKELVRSPLPEPRNSAMLVELVESLAATGKGNVTKTIRGMDIKSIKVDKTGAHRVLHLDLVSQDGAISGYAKITLQDNSDLPIRGVVNFSRGDATQQIETTWEYPTNGPADVFELGVPQETALIDRVPTPEVKQLVADVYKGRLSFDDYRAVVFATKSGTLNDIDSLEVSLVSKKGNRLALLRNADVLDEYEGLEAADVAAALLKNPSSINWQPATLILGQDMVRFSIVVANDPSVKGKLSYRISRNPNSPEYFICPSSHRVPNLVGRPMTGVGSNSTGASIVSDQSHGPEGCIQLRTLSAPQRASGNLEQEELGIGHQKTSDYWIDPTKGSLVIEYRTQMHDGATSTFTLGELTRSPAGHWYPKITTHTDSVTSQTTIYRYFIEFSNPLPDIMFEPDHYVETSP
ncbi:MAG: hypothetical protein MUC43_19365 [Pirellula sp.]|jgi:hypothetical protein|nr:hypothetical protein [Pirellula sp.]